MFDPSKLECGSRFYHVASSVDMPYNAVMEIYSRPGILNEVKLSSTFQNGVACAPMRCLGDLGAGRKLVAYDFTTTLFFDLGSMHIMTIKDDRCVLIELLVRNDLAIMEVDPTLFTSLIDSGISDQYAIDLTYIDVGQIVNFGKPVNLILDRTKESLKTTLCFSDEVDKMTYILRF